MALSTFFRAARDTLLRQGARDLASSVYGPARRSLGSREVTPAEHAEARFWNRTRRRVYTADNDRGKPVWTSRSHYPSAPERTFRGRGYSRFRARRRYYYKPRKFQRYRKRRYRRR